jgi:hypothetical protein
VGLHGGAPEIMKVELKLAECPGPSVSKDANGATGQPAQQLIFPPSVYAKYSRKAPQRLDS